ncbi:hypothetical protein GZH47_16790 [Paenibacillus rhizovicinus]|uniref:Uncharacterized protein n=1 Tax=Paenibacillus rhizovicinus TaxID=2704463 RepID=A0A6C0P182_9BACL|nr:hypothetical protein [Paenibacillus rhizovicinus]QHW32300.1 hypothetical protein GZH47_16790 [Paenibacillus rhizovicinus]
MKFIKTKVAAGVVAVGMLASMGTVFAATDAGGQLHNWYDAALGTVKTAINGDFATYKTTKLAAHKTAVDGIISKAQNDIRDEGNKKIGEVNAAVTSQTTQYGNQLDGAKGEILASMPAQFDAFVSTTNTATDTQLTPIATQNRTDINNAIKNHLGVYTGRLDLNNPDSRTAATLTNKKKELTDKINDVKTALQTALNSEKSTATTEIQNYLNAQLTDLEAQLQALADTGVADAKNKLDAKATTVLNNALGELDAIVDGIDN